MHHCWIALIAYYDFPAVVYGISQWTRWKKSFNNAMWDPRFDFFGVANSIVLAAVWPLAGFFIARCFYMRWPVGKMLSHDLDVAEARIRKLEAEIAQLKAANK